MDLAKTYLRISLQAFKKTSSLWQNVIWKVFWRASVSITWLKNPRSKELLEQNKKNCLLSKTSAKCPLITRTIKTMTINNLLERFLALLQLKILKQSLVDTK